MQVSLSNICKIYKEGRKNMSEILNESILSKKTEMYAMIISMEADFVLNFAPKINLDDVPKHLIERSKKVDNETDPLLKVLRGLDIQAYIEICNSNILKLSLNADQKSFLNQELGKIIPIRNAVMHPRPLGFYDYSMVKTLFENISTKLACFSWEHVASTKNQIEQHPETLIPPPTLKKSDRIIENLPTIVDYEETSFIGRAQEIAEIRRQLNRRNVNVLSIIGDGGIGKTAITLKLLYDMLDDPQCDYELIIWVSLKTNELSDYEFLEIKNSITSTAQIYEKLMPFVGADDSASTKDYIIELAKNFKTLFVLDNLETINTADVRDFIDDFSEYGKVLITSRIGLGEMEHRYKLQGLKESDVLSYADVLLGLYGFECYFTEERKKHLFCETLHANPLAIKWFIRCLYNGQTEDDILCHKDDLVNFCMANVYDKLSSQAKEVLDILTVAGVALSLPEIIYYLGKDLESAVDVKLAINELGKCNFISEDEFKMHNQVIVTDFARDFLSLHFSDVRTLLPEFKIKEQRMTSYGQNALANQNADPFRVASMTYKNNGERVITYYLSKALEDYAKNKDSATAFIIIKHCQELLPKFYENNLLLAHIHGVSSPLKAEQEHLNAISYSRDEQEKLRASIIYADYLIRNNEYSRALEFLKELQESYPSSVDIRLEKIKSLGCLFDFDVAFDELDFVEANYATDEYMPKIVAKRADLFRRQANRLDPRRTQEKLEFLRQGFTILEDYRSDDKIIIDHMIDIINELLHSYMDKESLEYAYEKLKFHLKKLRRSNRFKSISDHLDNLILRTNLDDLKKIKSLVIDISEYLYLLKADEAVVVNMQDGYGFCRNQERSGLYFSMVGLPSDLEAGDILGNYNFFESKGGPKLLNSKRVDNLYSRIAKEI